MRRFALSSAMQCALSRFRSSTITATSLTLSLLSGCTDANPPIADPTTTGSLRQWVSGRAEAALLDEDHFALAAAPDNLEPEITSEKAIALATIWAHSYAPMTAGFIAQTHGGSVTFAKLFPCGRALYARGAVASLPADLPVPYRKPFGPWWLVTFCEAPGGPALSVAVSAWATELEIERGILRFPRISGNEFFGVGVPRGHNGEFPSSPERAVKLVGITSARTAIEVPELVMPLNSAGIPQNARWRVRVAPVGSSLAESDELFVGVAGIGSSTLHVEVAARQQPSNVSIQWKPTPRLGERRIAYEARVAGPANAGVLRRKSSTPLSFEPFESRSKK